MSPARLPSPDVEPSAIAAIGADVYTPQARRYAVAVRHPDGSITRSVATGLTSIDHAIQAQERHGLGCTVRVEAFPPALQELLDDFSQRVAGDAA